MPEIRIICAILGVVAGSAMVLAAGQDPRFVEKIKFPGAPEVVVVAEGDFEPRSVGSYSVRIYSGLNSDFSLDDYVAGMVRPRSGVIERVHFHDFDDDGRAEILVIIRSVGSGGYLSAEAFVYAGKSLKLLAAVSGLSKEADPIRALTAKIKKGSQKAPAPDELPVIMRG